MIYRNMYKLVSILFVAALTLWPVSAQAIPKTGQPLPAFNVTTPSGQQVTNQNYNGRVLLLAFSTDYCSACKKAIPGLNKLADHYGKQGFHILGLFSGFGMENNDLKEYMKTYGVTYPMALFEQKFAADQFGVISVPYYLLIGKKGALDSVYYGYSEGTVKQIEVKIKKLLAE